MLPNLFGSAAAVASPSALRGGDKTGARSGNTERPSGADDFSALVDRAARARDTRSVHDGRPAAPARPSPASQLPRGTQAARPASQPAGSAARATPEAHPASGATRKPAAGQADADTEHVKARETDESKTVDVAAPVNQDRTPAPAAAAGGGSAAVAAETAMGQADAAGEAILLAPAEPGNTEGIAPDEAAQAAPAGAELAADAFAELEAEPDAAEIPPEPPADAARAAANAARLARLISQSGGAAEPQSEASRSAAEAAGRESVRPAESQDALNGLAADPASASAAGTASTAAGFTSDDRHSGSGGSHEQRSPALQAVTAAGAGASTFTLAAPVAAGTAATPAPPPGPETMNQLVQSMRTQFRNGIGEAVVRLNPDHLGAVSISLRVERGTVTASVAAESPSVRAWLESQEQTLRQNLAGQGLNLDRLVVHPDERDQARQQDEAASKRRQPRNPPDPDAPVFEIIV